MRDEPLLRHDKANLYPQLDHDDDDTQRSRDHKSKYQYVSNIGCVIDEYWPLQARAWRFRDIISLPLMVLLQRGIYNIRLDTLPPGWVSFHRGSHRGRSQVGETYLCLRCESNSNQVVLCSTRSTDEPMTVLS